jgi:hypothetical protein
MPPSTPNSNGSGIPHRNAAAVLPEQAPTSGSIIAEAQTLKECLRESYQQASRPFTALKRQRKQSKLVQNTIASLRHLQHIDG